VVPVTQFEGGDIRSLGVGDEAGVAPAGADVEERELGARVRALAPQITRMSAGQSLRSMISVSSMTSAPSRIPPSNSVALTQSSFWANKRASHTEPLMGNPIE